MSNNPFYRDPEYLGSSFVLTCDSCQAEVYHFSTPGDPISKDKNDEGIVLCYECAFGKKKGKRRVINGKESF